MVFGGNYMALLNMSDDEVKGLLFAYPAEPLAYDDWLKVGQALTP